MKSYVNDGQTVTLIAETAISAGDTLFLGDSDFPLFCIAAHDAAAGESVILYASGSFTVPKVAEEDWIVGQPIFSAFESNAPLTSTLDVANYRIGHAAEAAGVGTATGIVRLKN